MNFGTVVEGHNGWGISKNCEWEIIVTHLNNSWLFQLWPQSAPENFLIFLPKTTMLSVENKNMAKNRNRSSFRRHFGEKNDFGGFSEHF